MPLARARLDELEVPLVEPFETSFGRQTRRRILFVSLIDGEGTTGLGECVAAQSQGYSRETVGSARWAIRRLLLPALRRASIDTPVSARKRFAVVPRHRMAKAAVEMALWDLSARRRGRSLASLLGGHRSRVEVGVSVGIQRTIPKLVRRVGGYLEDGYRRVKLKVKPRWDERPVAAVRRAFPDVRLWVDANQAYPAPAAGRLRRWAERWNVEQVEQPFPARALASHARLQTGAPFRVCLDESVVDRSSLAAAVDYRALSSLNIKPGRVGGLGEAVELAHAASRARLAVWAGGMLETGVGRAHGVALASRSEFNLPADLSASDRYYAEDLIDRPFELAPGSTLRVPRGLGIGVEVDGRLWRRWTVRHREFTL
jgi:o-succinylbenzoate synthase